MESVIWRHCRNSTTTQWTKQKWRHRQLSSHILILTKETFSSLIMANTVFWTTTIRISALEFGISSTSGTVNQTQRVFAYFLELDNVQSDKDKWFNDFINAYVTEFNANGSPVTITWYIHLQTKNKVQASICDKGKKRFSIGFENTLRLKFLNCSSSVNKKPAPTSIC